MNLTESNPHDMYVWYGVQYIDIMVNWREYRMYVLYMYMYTHVSRLNIFP